MFLQILIVSMLICFGCLEAHPYLKKVLICGVCKDIESAVPYVIENAELLGTYFSDYRVIIYENNSADNTAILLTEWAKRNKNVIFVSEILDDISSISRTENIARARNKVLDIIKDEYAEYEYLINVDLDFQCAWPIDEILKTIKSQKKWDCVSANGLWRNIYWDRYAYRSKKHPFGPELIGDDWWGTFHPLFSVGGEEWLPVYSAFGGLAIYKTATVINFRYSGIVTLDLQDYYKNILQTLTKNNTSAKKYLDLIHWNYSSDIDQAPILFRYNTVAFSPPHYPYITCCEHMTLHASMAMHGFGKIYINPKMQLHYPH